MARASKRAGNGPHRGSINPKITVSAVAPAKPKTNDLWYDTGTSTLKYYNGSTWTT